MLYWKGGISNMNNLRLLTDEEIKEMHEYMDKVIKPQVLRFLEEDGLSIDELEATGKDYECPECEHEIELEVSFKTFRSIECPECGEIISPCGVCRDLGDYLCEKCPITWIINKKRLEKELEDVCKAIEDFEPDHTSKEVIRSYEDYIDSVWEAQHRQDMIRIANSCFYPSDVIKKLDPLGFKDSCRMFAGEMIKEDFINLPSYKKLIDMKESIKNELKTLLNVPGLLPSPAPEKTKKSGVVDAIIKGKDK